MKRTLILAAFLMLMALPAFSQQITITGTVQDTNGNIYQNGTGKVVLVPQNVGWTTNNGYPVNQTVWVITGLGGFAQFSVQLPSSASFDQQSQNPQYTFSFCSATYPIQGNVCFTTTPITLTTSQDITAFITPQAAILPITSSGGISVNTIAVPNANFQNNAPITWNVVGSNITPVFTNPFSVNSVQQPSINLTNSATITWSLAGNVLTGLASATFLGGVVPNPTSFTSNATFGGPNPYVDPTASPYNFRSAVINTTGSGSASTLNVGVSSFQNNDGIVVAGVGALPSIATPTGLTVASGVAGGPTVPDGVFISSSTGSSTYCYVLFAIDIFDGATLPTAPVCTTTAAANLGATTFPASAWSLTSSTLSTTTTAANNLPAGTWFHTTGTTNNALAGGWYPISTAGTTITTNNVPQFAATTTSGSGGQVVAMLANGLSWNPSTGGTVGTLNMPWEYFVCAERPGDGSYHIIGRSFPSTFYAESNSGNFSTTFVDYGAIITANPLIPWDISDANCTAGSVQREMFRTTVQSGGGTTALGLTNPLPSFVSGALVRKDDATAFLAAATAAHNNGGNMYIPITTSGMVINSPVNLPFSLGIMQAGSMAVNAPIIVKGSTNWNGSYGIAPTTAFGFNGSSVITCTAYPCIYVGDVPNQANGGTTFDTVTMISAQNGLNMLVDANWGMVWNQFNSQSGSGNNDTMGISLAIRPGAASYTIQNSSFSGGPNQVIDRTWTPLVFTDKGHAGCCGGAGGVGTLTMNNIDWNRRGFYALTNGGDGLHFTATTRQYSQGGITPRFVAHNINGNVGGQIEIDNAFHDTESQAEYAWICNLACSGGFGVPTHLGFVNALSPDAGTIPNQITGGGNQGIMQVVAGFSPSGTSITGSFGAVPTGHGWIYSAGRLTPTDGISTSGFGTTFDFTPNVATPILSLENSGFFGNLTAPGLTGNVGWTMPPVSGVVCLVSTCGGGGTGNFQVNGTPLISATTVNFQSSNPFNGLTFTFTNPSVGNVQLGASGTLGNSGLTNSTVVINGQSVALGASGNIPFQVNGVNNTSLAGLNLVNSSANLAGLAATFANTSSNSVNVEITGIANQAAALAALGTQCTGGNFATGIDVHGNANCSIPSASGNVTNGGTSFTVPGGSIIASNNIATVFSSSAYLDCSSPAFTAADWGLIAQACLSALNTINSISGTADMRGVSNSMTASVNPEGGTMPASGKMLMGPGTYLVNVPFVDHGDWSLEGESVRGFDAQVGTTIKAGASFQATYTTGTITTPIGTPGAGEVITLSGATLSSSMIGCAFYGNNGAATSTFGIITAVNPGAGTLTLGFGANNSTGAVSTNPFTIACPVHAHGNGSTGAGAQFGMMASNINFDCNNVAGCISDLDWYGQQGTGTSNVGIHGSINIGLDVETPFAQNSGPWDRDTISPGSSCVSGTLLAVFRVGSPMKPVSNMNTGKGSCGTTPAVGVTVDKNYVTFTNPDLAGGAIAIQIGGNTACPIACAIPAAVVSGVVVDGAYGEPSSITTMVKLSNALGTGQGNRFSNFTNSATNALIDSANACTITDARLASYITTSTGTVFQNSQATPSAACAPALTNGTTATTQTLGDNSTKVATDAFVIANAGSVGPGSVNGVAYFVTANTLNSVLGTITGQVLTVQNGNPPIFAGPGIAGTIISSASPYTVQCDSGTTQLDRLKTLIFTAAAGVTVTVPDAGAVGCGSNFTFSLVAGPGAGTVTVNRTSSSSFIIVNGTTALTAQTTFNLTVGQSATLNSYDNANYLVRIPGGSGGSSVTLQTNGVNNSVQTTYNLINSAAFNGLTVTATNTIGGTVQLGLSGTLGNSGLTNPSTTVNGQSCALGGTCTIPFQTNSVNDTSQNGINLLSGAATNGVTITVTNTASNQVQVGISGTLNNSGLTNSATTVNAQTCTLGGTCTINPPLDKSTNGLANPTADATFTYPAASVSGLTLAGTAPASVSTSTGTSASTLFQVNGVVGGATSNATGTGGVGSQPTLAAGNGGAGTGTNAVGGAGGNFTITTGNGGASNGTGANSNGGNFIVNLGTAGTGGSGAAGAPGLFELNGVGAGAYGYDQGADNCVKILAYIVTGACMEAPSSGMTNYRGFIPPVAATGVITNNVSAAVDTQGFSGDSGHSATVTIGSGTSIGSTSLCSTAICPVGTYDISVYVDITTACGTSGTYIVNLIYTDDQGSKTVPVNLQGTGAVPLTGTLTTTSTSNFGQQVQVIRSTGAASINYSTTATACGTAGPMVGKLYLSATPKQ